MNDGNGGTSDEAQTHTRWRCTDRSCADECCLAAFLVAPVLREATYVRLDQVRMHAGMALLGAASDMLPQDAGDRPPSRRDALSLRAEVSRSPARVRPGICDSGHIDQSQTTTVAAVQIAEKKVCAHRPYRVAIRRRSLSFAKRFSTWWRWRYRLLAYG